MTADLLPRGHSNEDQYRDQEDQNDFRKKEESLLCVYKALIRLQQTLLSFLCRRVALAYILQGSERMHSVD